MIFVRSFIENFFSISDQITWEMENQGLVLIAGENHDSQAACSNGAGKSTLFEALVWALWGKTTRGQAGDSVVNRQSKKNCRVEVWIRHDGDLYRISRYRKHDKAGNLLEFEHYEGGHSHDLTQGTPTLTQDKISTFLGIDYDTFIQGPMIPQGHFKKFSEMTDGEQKAIFDRALQIGVLSEALKETTERISTVTQHLNHSKYALDASLEAVNKYTDQIIQYQTERDNWGKEKQRALRGMAKEILAVVDQQEELWGQAQVENFDQDLAQSKQKKDQLYKDLEKLQRVWADDKTKVKDNLANIRVEWKEATAQVRILQNEIRNMENLQGAACPTCGQEVSKQHVSTCLAGSKKDLVLKSTAAAELAKQIETIDSAWATKEAGYNQAFSKLTATINEQEASHRALLNRAAESKAWMDELVSLQKQESTLRGLYKKKQEEVTFFDKLISDGEGEILKKQRELISRTAHVRRATLELEYLQFWQYGFSNKGLKSHILASVTPYLNGRVKHYIKSLAGGELDIEFSTQTTLKSGETREKFSVQVTNRSGADTYIGNSGGEKGRADLAINFVLADLMSSRSRRPYPQRFLDEPFENLDESGVEAVMELLSDLAVDSGSIFVITHLDSMKGLFAKTLKLIKKNGITTLVSS